MSKKKKKRIEKLLKEIRLENKKAIEEFPCELSKLNLTADMYWWNKDVPDKEKKYKKRWGFGYSENYCLFMWIALNLYPRLIEFKANKVSYPCNMTNEEWNNILDKMILAFKFIIEDEQMISLDTGKDTLTSEGEVTFIEENGHHYMDFTKYKSFINGMGVTTDEYKEYQKKRDKAIKEGLQLFADHFYNLWD